jgi:hypothetical protein
VKQNLNECTRHKSLTLSDVETPMMEFSNKHMYSKHRHGMKAKIND